MRYQTLYRWTRSTAGVVLLAAPCWIGCEVEQTQKGELPKVDVKEGKLPKFDVDLPKVELKMKKKEVEVPKVDVHVEKKAIEVPDIDVHMPDDDPDVDED